MLRDALRALASTPDEQVRYLTAMDVPVCVDELALDYDAIAAAAGDMLDNGEIDREQFECVHSLDELPGKMSGPDNAYLWTENALRIAPEWDQVRSAAIRCLSLLSGKRR